MIDNETPIATLLDRVEDYSNSTIELFKLNVIDKSADIISSLVSRIVIIMTVALSILITSVGLALWIGKYLGDSSQGFFIVGGAYAFIALLLFLFRHNGLKTPISNAVIKQALKQKAV